MKLFLYLISVIFIFAFMGLFFLKNPNGQAWLTIDDLIPNTYVIDKKIDAIKGDVLATYKGLTADENSQIKQDGEVKIYRWKDSKGNWSYSDKPKFLDESEQVFLDSNNIVALPPLKPSLDKAFDLPATKDKSSPSPLTISPSKVLELYKDVNNIQKLVDDRQKHISQAIKDNG